jgi:hypothetical protein
MVPLTLRKG